MYRKDSEKLEKAIYSDGGLNLSGIVWKSGITTVLMSFPMMNHSYVGTEKRKMSG